MKALTIRQKLVLDFIRNYVEENEYAPSFREIQTYFGFASLASVHKYIKALENKEMLTTTKGCSRSLELKDEALIGQKKASVTVPFMGDLTEKEGIETLSQVKTMDVPQAMVSYPKRNYLLRVRGHFLRNVAIDDGDLLIIESNQEPEPDKLVLVQIAEKQFCVQKYYPESGGIRLEDSEKDKGSFYPFEQITIYGILVAVLRTF